MMKQTKYIVMSLLLGSFAISAQAQDAEIARQKAQRDSLLKVQQFNALEHLWQPRYRYANDEWESNGLWDHTYLQVGTGIFNVDAKEGSTLNFLQAMNLTIGRDITPYHGIRLGGGYNFAKASEGSFNYKTFEAHVDWLFNLSNYSAGYKKNRWIDIQTVLGLGFQRTNYQGIAKTLPAARLGTQVRFRLGDRNYLALEPLATVYRNNGMMTANDKKYVFDYGLNLNWGYYIHPDAVIAHPKDGADALNPVFFEIGVGPMWRNNEFTHTKKTMGPAYNFNIGTWMSPVWGVRGGFTVGQSTYDYALSNSNNTMSRTAVNLGVHGDLLFNPFGLKSTYNEDQKVGAFIFGGMSYGLDDEHTNNYVGYHGYHAGLNLWARIDKNAELFIEPQITRQMYSTALIEPDQTLYSIMAGARLKTYQRADRDARALETFNPYWFLQNAYGFGAQVREIWQNGTSDRLWRGNWEVALGRRFTGLVAARLAFGQRFNWKEGNYRDTEIAPELMFNLNTMFNRYSSEDRFNIWTYAGPSYSIGHDDFGDDNKTFGVVGGFQFDYALDNSTSIFMAPELRYQTKRKDWTVDYKLGVSYRFDGGNNYDSFWKGETYVQLGGGIDRISDSGENFGTGVNAFIGVGKWYNRWLGTNFNGTLTVNKSDIHKLLLLGGQADVTIDPISLLAPNYNRRNAAAGITLLGGGSLGVMREALRSPIQTDYRDHFYTGFNYGAQLWARVSSGTRIFAQGVYSHLRNGDIIGRHYLKPLDLTVGVAFDYDYDGGTEAGYGAQTLEEALLNYQKAQLDHRYWFIQSEYGLNINMTKQMAKNSKANKNGLWGAALGYRWNNTSAFRLAADQRMNVGENDHRSLSAALEYMMNLNSLVNHANEKVNLWAYAGPFVSATHENQISGKDKWKYGVAAGIQLDFQTSKNTSIFLAPEIRKDLTGTHRYYNLATKAGVTYRFDNGDYYGTFWDDNSFMEVAAGVQKIVNDSQDSKWGPSVSLALGKWFDRTLGTKVIFSKTANNGDKRDYHSTGAAVDLLIDPVSMLSPSYDRQTAAAGFNIMLGGEFGFIHEYRNTTYLPDNYTHLFTGFNEGAQLWFRTNPTSRVFVEARASQLRTGNNSLSRWHKPIQFMIGTSFDYNPSFMREEVTEREGTEFFVQAGAGGVMRNNGNHHVLKSGYSIAGTVGLQTDGLHGVRLSYDYNDTKDRTFSNISLDYQLDLLRMWQGANANKYFGVYAFAGPMLNLTDMNNSSKNTTNVGARVGAELRLNLFGGAYLHVTPMFDWYQSDGLSHTWLRGVGGFGYRF